MGRNINIDVPTLLINPEICLTNLERMVKKAQVSDVKFRPHFKTHQSSFIGNWFKPYGVDRIAVSSVDMAYYFAMHGWMDITIAFPVNILEIDKINKLAEVVRLNLLVENAEAVRFLGEKLTQKVNAYIKIDVGYKRTGINWKSSDQIVQVAQLINKEKRLEFIGLLAFAGHSYLANSSEEIKDIYLESVRHLNDVKEYFLRNGFSKIELSFGDTPTCSVIDNFTDIDEIRPGNFIFYDVMQLQLGSCKVSDIAVVVACPVVAKHENRNEIVIYGGAAHLSKEFILRNDNVKNFGYVTLFEENGWGKPIKNTFVSSLSQEHGVIKADSKFFHKVNIGDIILIIPIHSCLVVNQLRRYLTLKGKVINTRLLP